MDSKGFSALEIDAIGEILNISLGASATAVSTMLSARVDITTPVVQVLSKAEFEFSNLEPAVGVEITYVAGLSGNNIMLLKRHDVKVIVEMMMGMEIPDEEFELNELNISAICEVMNQMMGASSTALSEFLNKMVNISTPTSFEIKDVNAFKDKYFETNDPMVVIGFTLKIADKLESEFINVMPPELAKELVAGFLPDDFQMGEEEAAPAAPTPAPAPASAPEPSGGGGMMSQEEIEKLLSNTTDSAAPEPAPASSGSSGGVMSQEEIERLLAGSAAPEPEPTPAAVPEPAVQTTPQPAIQPQAPTADVGMQPQNMAMPGMAAMPMGQMPMMPDTMAQQQMINQMAQMQQQMMNQMAQMQQQMMAQMQNTPAKEPAAPKTVNVHPMPKSNLNSGEISGEEQEENRELIMGVPLEVSVEIGRTKKLVKDILEFTKGSLVILDKLAGEQVDLFVNGQCIAKGDVVVIDDNFGIRITEIVRKNPPAE